MKTVKQILEDTTAPLPALGFVLVEALGTESFEWEPELVRKELEDKYNLTISDLQSDKIQALIVILTTNQFESNVRVFEVLTSLINHTHQDFEDFEPAEAEEIVVAITEVLLLKMEELDFSPDVRAYAGRVFHEYGFSKAPNLFPEAIMPEGFPADIDDKEKNLALSEIFDSKVDRTTKYLAEVI